MNRNLKVLTIVGTRPEIIRLSRVMARLDEVCTHVIVHTGQNHDYQLNGVFFEDLAVREPDHFLGVDTSSLGSCVGGILVEVEKVLLAEKPNAVLILGDTNSAISAYMARRLKIPVYHMEAGNRCFDRNVPEETNRRMVDHISDFNLVYSEHARRNLLSEGLHPRRVYITGSPMWEVLSYYRTGIERSDVLSKLSLQERGYILASLHREENVDNLENLARLVNALDALAHIHDCRVVVSTHPRTRKRLDMVATINSENSRIQWLEPFGFNDYNRLQMSARCVVSDSGTIAEESSMLGFPAVTPRFSIERPEAIDTGAIMACGTDPEAILRCVDLVVSQTAIDPTTMRPDVYSVENTSERVVRLIVSTAGLSNNWDGIGQIEQRV